MEPVTSETLTEFLTQLGERYSNQATLYLLGGSALLLLGNPRQTLDIDYTTDLHPQEQQALETVMNQLAAQYRLEIRPSLLRSLFRSLLGPRNAGASLVITVILTFSCTISTPSR